jgi:hypothetical protein
MKVAKTKCTFKDFPVGEKVKVISEIVDFFFFDGEIGVVEKNTEGYLGIKVKFDKPYKFKQNSTGKIKVKEYHNFNPENLTPIILE